MFVLLGSNGNITSKAARILLSQGRKVRVVGRNAASLAELRTAGADITVGDIANASFLAGAFKGAEAVYVMIPPNYGAADMGAFQDQVGQAIVDAIKTSGVTRVVHLSSVGAHLPSGTGPIAGLHRQEQRLNALSGVDVLHLRPGYFFENHLAAIGLIQTLGVYADMTDSSSPIPTIGSGDIAVVVARELANFGTRGKAVLHLHTRRDYTQAEAAAILGRAIGHPELKHVQADPAQAKAGMEQHGFSPSVSDLFEEMSKAFSTPALVAELKVGPTEVTPTSLEDFAAGVFKPAFEGALKVA
ncbi:MAG: NAD(P)H-binding protein [Betaproteobacteria bacterium]|nr:NAD(P)H-binding protein [Betaproteobacteria bacterium]